VSTYGRLPATGRHLDKACWNFFIFKFYFFGSLGYRPGLLGERVYSTPIFWSLPLHLEVLNVPFLMDIGDFTFFQILFFLNLDYTWTFISTVGIFVSWKIKITKNSSSFASVMEIFCTLLQYRVHLSMFHSWSTSKIWHTSTEHDVHDNGAKAQSCVVQNFCTRGSQSLLSLLGTVEKKNSFHFKRYNLTIRAVKCRETFCTCSPSSLRQDPTVKSEKKWKKSHLGFLS
jgi:hypothetical protein